MDIVHRHNLARPEDLAEREKRFGIRVSLPPEEPLARLLGPDWETFHWYATQEERDAAFEQMVMRHGYYRDTDTPTQILEKLVR